MNKTKVAIFGVGLIGGSLALCFRDEPDITVVGHAHRPELIDKYMSKDVVDYATESIEEAASDADVIFLCVPVGKLEQYLTELSRLPLKKGCIITDVGSTKASISEAAKSLPFKDVYFIGGHPMAGSEQSGVDAASILLFENAYYVLCPPADVPTHIVEVLEKLISYTRARIVKVEPKLHDEIVGAISHLPHIIAVALVNQISEYNESNMLYRRLAAGGFRDITRIASSDPVIWRDILLNNHEVMLRLLQDWNEGIASFIDMLTNHNGQGIEDAFLKANAFRNELPEGRKGMITSLFDLYLNVPDHPGIIGKITTELGAQQINLSNIQIIESREEVPGVMRLSFRVEEDMEKAKRILQELQYTVFS
ncbi:prephenate dehydrogenase [Paenibacillus sp. CMAA1364]